MKKQNGDGFGTSLSYDFGGSDFAIIGAYANSDRTNEQNQQARGHGQNAEGWATGLKYDGNDIYLATIYSETRNMAPISGGFANKAQNFEAVAQYQFDFGLRPSIGYVQSKGKDIEGIGDEDIVKYIDVGATIISTRICRRLLIIKSTRLMITTNWASTAMTSWRWV